MKLITETVEEVKYITEEDNNGVKSLYIQGPFLVAETKNRNGRSYPVSVLENEVNRYMKEYVEKNRAFGELGHPESPTINLERVSHMITNIKRNGNIFEGKAKVLDTPMGKIAKNLMEAGATLGVSSRGMGSLKNVDGVNIVQPDFYLATAADIVADPSAPGAFVQGIMEGREWIWDNGRVKEMDVNAYYEEIKTAKQKQLDEISLKIFENFLSKL
jgi:Prohead core protein serine protease